MRERAAAGGAETTISIATHARLDGLQVLRFIAALLVLSGHLVHEGAEFGLLPAWAEQAVAFVPWYAGVDIFFVISGFIMYHVSADAFGREGAQKSFLLRRFARLVPLYWLFSIAMLAAILLLPGRVASATMDGAHIAASFVFIPWIGPNGLTQPVLALGWTLNYEMFFYLVFSCALLLPRRAGVVAIFALFFALALIHPLLDPEWVQLRFWTNPIILEFLGGIAVAYWLHRTAPPSPLVCLALGLGGAAMFLAMPWLPLDETYGRAIGFGISGALMVTALAAGGFEARGRVGQWAVLAGDASYALYLSHPFTVNLVALLLGGGIAAGWLFVPLGLVAAIGASIPIYLLIEKPLTRHLNRLLGAKRPLPSTPAAAE